MKIIFASKFYYRRGGLEAYLFKTKELLEAQGHQVIPFSTDFYENYETEYSEYFCRYHNLSQEEFSKNVSFGKFKAIGNMFFNMEAYNKMKQLIEKTKPDIVQGFGVTKHLSYSIFKAAKDMGVPTIMRLSDYAILCPNTTAVDGFGEICHDFSCAKNDFTKILKRKCIHRSVLASVIGKCEVKTNIMLDVYKKYVDYFIAPSRFIRRIFIDHFRISPQRIYYLPIFLDALNDSALESDEGYFLYAGRLSSEKGVYTLLKAFSINNKYKIVIAGTGPDEKALKEFAQKENVNAEFIGFQNYESLKRIIKKCSAVIIPSEWYENSPNIILEAYAQGKPAIGSNIGGIPELIEEGETGYLFNMGDVVDLADKVRWIYENKSTTYKMGRKAKEVLTQKYSQDEHYEHLVNIYSTIRKKKVLLVNNYYYNRGGDCTYLFGVKRMLEERGHNVVVFSMHHPQNIESTWSKYFVNYINYDEEVKKITLSSGIKVASRTIYFLKARKMINKLIKEEKPDIAHLQNIHHHITPSILYAFRKNKIPVAWTLHDYQLICPNISFLANGEICERCKKKRYYAPVLVRCKKGSLTASLMSSIEIIIHTLMGVDRLVNKFIAPSRFIEKKFIEYGFSSDKIKHISHFTNLPAKNEPGSSQDYYLFVGRISEEKGVKTLVDAAIKTNRSKLKIIGGGALLEEMVNYTKAKDENNIVEFLGHKSRDEVDEILAGCKFLVIPSEWYEISGLVILEAFACGKPVVGSRIGGIPELIEDNVTGLTFEMGNANDLSLKIEYMLNNPDEVRKMSINAREFVEKELQADNHYEKIIEVYNEISK